MWLTNRSTPTSDVIVLVWGEGTSGALCFDRACGAYQRGTLLYRPKTTWNTGRNQLLQTALECPRNYTYFIFMDGDAEIVEARDFGFNTGDPYRTFEGYLRRWQPAVSFPGFFADPKEMQGLEVSVTYNFDAIVNAFHREALEMLLPYDTHWDRRSWWYSQYCVIMLSAAFFNQHRSVHLQPVCVVCVCVCARARACVRVCVRVCVRAHVCVYTRTHARARAHTHTQAADQRSQSPEHGDGQLWAAREGVGACAGARV